MAFKPTSGFTSTSTAHPSFNFSDGQRPTNLLNNKYIQEPFMYVHRSSPYSPEEIARANLLGNTWTPKGDTSAYPQRCPAVWVDNFCIFYTADMAATNEEEEVLMGRWTKKVEVYGVTQELDGIALAAGGHYERCARKANKELRDPYGRYSGTVKPEEGDMGLRAAADKELKEEVGIDPRNVRLTLPLMVVDDPLGDPRVHGLRFIFLRWIEQTPRASKELPNILSVPTSTLLDFCNGRITWPSPEGKELSIILGHHELIPMILECQRTKEFISYIKTQANGKRTCMPQLRSFNLAK